MDAELQGEMADALNASGCDASAWLQSPRLRYLRDDVGNALYHPPTPPTECLTCSVLHTCLCFLVYLI
jgi:hypothetical protein